jgi:hypothetical protein
MRNILLGEVWESFYVEGHKVGFLHRITTTTSNPEILVSKLHIRYGVANFQHIFSFYNKTGYPPHSYIFDTNDGAPVHVRFTGSEMICQVDVDIFNESIPSNARPSYGNYPLIVTIPFVEGFKISFTQIDDAPCTLLGPAELVSKGWENVVVGDQKLRLWAVAEYTKGQPGNRYWLDDKRRIRQSFWRGAVSYWVATKEEALTNLPTELTRQMNEPTDTGNDLDWTTEIIDWLNE